MKFCGDYHIHTYASDGRASVERCARAAKDMGLSEIAISDHSFSSLIFHMTDRKFKEQRKRIDGISRGVKILQGIEGNLIGDRLDVPTFAVRSCDVLTVGFHRFISPTKKCGQGRFLRVNGFGSRRQREKLIIENTEAYLSVMERYPVDILAHLGHRAQVDFARVCAYAAQRGVYVELNAKHLDALSAGIDDAIASGVNFIVGSDAHSVDRIGKFDEVERFIIEKKIPVERVFGIGDNKPVFKDKKEWKYGDV